VWPWHPPAFVAAIVLTTWLDAAVSPYAAFRSLGIAVVGAILVVLVLAAVARSLAIGGALATAVVVLLWSKGILDLAAGFGSRMGPLAVGWWAMLAVAGVLIVRIATRAVRGRSVASLSTVLNRAAALLLLATLLFGLVNGRLVGAAADLEQGTDLSGWARGTEPAEPSDAPDIYAILLDGYPRADVLEYAFGIDNQPFADALASRGFDVANEAHSDYLWTHVSLPAALNMAYVEQIPAMQAVIEGRMPRQPTLRRTVTDNAAFEVAREHGYTAVAVGSGFEEVAPRQADVYLDGGQLNEFELSLLSSTYLGDLVSAVVPGFAAAQQRDRIRGNLDFLPRIAATPGRGPAFVFAHIPAPHQPVVFGVNGTPVDVPITDAFFADSPAERGEDPAGFMDRYADQLPYLNGLVLDAIDAVLAASDEPPVIVLFADHGSASVVDWNAVDPAEAEPARLLERTGILLATFTPGREDLVPDDASPTNVLRLVFDAYLGTSLGIVEPPPGGGHVPPVDASVLARD
jgi:hypothetical protein